MYSGELVLRDGKFTEDFEDMQVTIHDLRHYVDIHTKENEFLANAFYPEKEEDREESIGHRLRSYFLLSLLFFGSDPIVSYSNHSSLNLSLFICGSNA